MPPSSETHVCTWIYVESEDEESAYSQMRGRPSSDAFQAVYWRCVCVFFATSHRQQPNVRHLLFTNVETLPRVDGVDIASFMDRLGVEVVRLPLTFATPQEYYSAWRNQFYVFDIVGYLSRRLELQESAILLDSDCVWIASAQSMADAMARDGALTYIQHYSPEWNTNGLTRTELASIASGLLGAEVAHPLLYCGGELIAATGAELSRLASEIELTWGQLMKLHEHGEPKFNEEGQTLSYIYHKLGYTRGNGNAFVRRIWTGSLGSYNNVLSDDNGLVLWHLPTEKRFGFRRLFPQAVQRSSTFWAIPIGRPFREYLGSYLGVPRNTPRKQAGDFLKRLSDRARERQRA